jgi:hypothetical protein
MPFRATFRLLSIAAAALMLSVTHASETRESVPEQKCSSHTEDASTIKIEDLKWLAGAWGKDERGNSTEEHWIAPKGGMMLAVNRTVFRSGKTSFEFLRISETPEGLTYFASPRGAEPTPFRLKEATADSVTFENPDHDFPQRIIYRKVDGNLVARIEGRVQEKDQSMEWTWKPMSQ